MASFRRWWARANKSCAYGLCMSNILWTVDLFWLDDPHFLAMEKCASFILYDMARTVDLLINSRDLLNKPSLSLVGPFVLQWCDPVDELCWWGCHRELTCQFMSAPSILLVLFTDESFWVNLIVFNASIFRSMVISSSLSKDARSLSKVR